MKKALYFMLACNVLDPGERLSVSIYVRIGETHRKQMQRTKHDT